MILVFLSFVKAKKNIITYLNEKFFNQDEKIIKANLATIDLAIKGCKKIDIKKMMETKTEISFVQEKGFSSQEQFYQHLSNHQGNKLSVSHFCSNGLISCGSTRYQKPMIAKNIPI